MYQNPFAIKPGEKLTPQELFERYLVWSNYARSIEAWKEKATCDNDLHKSWLCCEDHVKYQLEMDHFKHYFVHHFIFNPLEPGFSIDSMVKAINEHNFRITPEIKRELIKYWGSWAPTFFEELGD